MPTTMLPNLFFIYSCNWRWDTAWQDAYEEARRVVYHGTSILLISFSLVDPDSFANVMDFWVKEANLDELKNVPVSQPLFLSPNLELKLTSNKVATHSLNLWPSFWDIQCTPWHTMIFGQENLKLNFQIWQIHTVPSSPGFTPFQSRYK